MSQPRDGSSPDSVVCVLGAGQVSRMCPGRGILQCHVSIHRRDTFGYEIARHGGPRSGFDGRRATGRSCCPRGAAPGPVVALAIPGWNNLTARVFSVVPVEGRCDRWGAATTE